MGLEVEIARPLEEHIERRGVQEAVELEVADAVSPWRELVRGGHDVKAALIKDHGVGLDLALLRVLARRLIFGLDDTALENCAMDSAQDAVLPLVALGGQAADVEDLAIGFIVLPDRGGQLVFELVPEGFDGVPEGGAGERIEEVAAEREGDQLAGRGIQAVGLSRLGPQPPDLAPTEALGLDVEARGNQGGEVALDGLYVQRLAAHLANGFVAQLLEREADAGALQNLQQPVLSVELLVACHAAGIEGCFAW